LALADMLRNEFEVEASVSTSALSHIFEEEPPPLHTFVTDAKFLNNASAPLSPIQYDFVRHFEQVLDLETYILMVEEFGEYWSPVRYVNHLASEWGKGSNRRTTPIYNARTGQWQRLDSFEGGAVASAYPEDGKVFAAEGTKSFREGYGRMFKVTTKSGLITECWEGHRFLARQTMHRDGSVPVEWQRLWDLKVGDRIAVSSFVPEPTDAVRLPDHEVEIAGLFVGDGCWSPGTSQPSICGGPAAIKTLARVQKVLSELPNCALRVRRREDGKWDVFTKVVDKAGRRGGAPNPLKDFLHRYSLQAGAHEKRVPAQIFSAPTDQVALFVSRLIDTDGWISVSNTVEVGYGTVCRDLAEDVRRLLLRLGVASGVRQKNATYKDQPHTSWQVKVRDRESVQTLLQQLRLLDKEPIREAALAWCEERSSHKKSRHKLGNLWFDTIVSIEYMDDDEYWTLSVDGPADYIASSGILDHNSGKDHCCQVSFARVANILLCLRNPNQYYGLAPQTIIHMLNVAASAPQAHGVFFKPLRWLITHSPWFSDKFEGDEPGPQATEIRFAKQIELISGHSQAETLEGKNLIAAIADEISAFPTKDEVQQSRSGRTPAKTSDSILDMLKSSATTRFPENFKLAQISYPRFKGDAIEKAIIKGRADNIERGDSSRFYVSGPLATWDVNPRYDKYERIEVRGATGPIPNTPSIVEDYEKDPAYARAKYECLPELAENRFFHNDDAIMAAFSEVREVPPIEFEYYWGFDEGGSPFDDVTVDQKVPGWQVRFNFASDLRPVSGALYAIHGDMAISGDRAGVAMCHVKRWERRDWKIPGGEMLENRPFVKVDFVNSFTADPGGEPSPREVQIRWYRKLIWELRSRGFFIAHVSFDNFQSADSIQILNSWGIEAVKASTDRSNELYDTLKDVMYDSRLEGYYRELLITEIQTLSKMKNGRIDHVPNGSKDEADALAGAVAGAVKIGGDEGSERQYADEDVVDLFTMPGASGADVDYSMTWAEVGPLGMDGGGVGSHLW
jgi:intein/homing endonuclease